MPNLPGIYTIIYEIVMYFIVTIFTVDVKFYIKGKSGDNKVHYNFIYYGVYPWQVGYQQS